MYTYSVYFHKVSSTLSIIRLKKFLHYFSKNYCEIIDKNVYKSGINVNWILIK